MKKLLNWNELLIIGGFLSEAISETQINLMRETFENVRFLKTVLENGAIDYGFNYPNINFISAPLSNVDWIKLLNKVGERSTGMLLNQDDIELFFIDVSMRSIIRQLNRLELITSWSCVGHGKRTPYIMFKDTEHALTCFGLLKNLGYDINRKSERTILLNLSEIKLYNLGLDLSKLTSTDEYCILNCIYNRNEEQLEELLMIPGKSGCENLIREYLVNVLSDLTDEVIIDSYGNILASKKNGEGATVLLSAHMDMYDDICEDSKIIKEGNRWFRDYGILGADDRAGIALILNLLSKLNKRDFKGTLKIAFTVEEETGQHGAENIDKEFFSDIDYAISLDRRSGSDIVVRSPYQEYCTSKYSRIFEYTSKSLGHRDNAYKAVQGGISDLRVWSELGIESVNLSIGYYNEHRDNEYLNIDEWHRAFEFIVASLRRLQYKRSNENIKIFI